MALQWQWKDKIGEAIVADNFTHRTFTKTLYEGNAFLIMLTEWNEDGIDKYALYTFFADETHAKNCLGLTKNHDNIFTNGGYGAEIVKIRINKKKSRNYKKIVSLFAQAFDNIDIEIFSEENKDD